MTSMNSLRMSLEKGMKQRVMFNLVFIFQVFFPVHTLQKLIRVQSLDSNDREFDQSLNIIPVLFLP